MLTINSSKVSAEIKLLQSAGSVLYTNYHLQLAKTRNKIHKEDKSNANRVMKESLREKATKVISSHILNALIPAALSPCHEKLNHTPSAFMLGSSNVTVPWHIQQTYSNYSIFDQVRAMISEGKCEQHQHAAQLVLVVKPVAHQASQGMLNQQLCNSSKTPFHTRQACLILSKLSITIWNGGWDFETQSPNILDAHFSFICIRTVHTGLFTRLANRLKVWVKLHKHRGYSSRSFCLDGDLPPRPVKDT